MKITQNQYFNKSKYLSSSKLNFPYEPKHTCDISSGYIQSKNLSLFQGVSEELDCGGNSTFEYAYFLLTNLKKSNINIYVRNSLISNLSANPIMINIYYCVKDVVGNLDKSNFTTIANSNASGKLPHGKILFGNDLEKIYGIYGQNLVVSPYSTYNCRENGGIVISPGFSYLFEFSSINTNITSNFTMSFSWWEEDISSYID
ncbi:DUF6143 family protein [Terrisporobacter sp.]